jgi:hypothetical protein
MIPLELLPEEITESTLVEASRSDLAVAKQAARRRGFGDRTSYEHGDFVDLAPGLPEADLVTLDRVFCCSPHMERLARASTAKAARWYGVTYPKLRWYGKVIEQLAGVYCWARDMDLRMCVHSGIEHTIRTEGFEPFYQVETIMWKVELYERREASA